MHHFPLVSVVVPTYNRSCYLSEAIQSVFVQEYVPLEIIVVDDGSTDNTREVLHQYFDRVTCIYQSNQGAAVARNVGIAASKGAYIALLDSDDIWRPGKLREQVQFLNDKPYYGMVGCKVVEIAHDGSVIQNGLGDDVSQEYVALERVLLDSPLPPSTLLVRREALPQPYPFTPGIHYCEDWEFCLRVALIHPIGYINQPLVGYRSHSQNLTFPIVSQAKVEEHLCNRLRVLTSIATHVPPELLAAQAKAEANEYARFSIPTYMNGEFVLGAARIATAIRLDPERWYAGGELAEVIVLYAGLLLHQRGEREAFVFLDNVFAHLPVELKKPEHMRAAVYARIRIAAAFEDYRQRQFGQVLTNIFKATVNNPTSLANRGVLSITARSLVPPLRHRRVGNLHR